MLIAGKLSRRERRALEAMCPDSSASRTVRKVLETWDHKLSWGRMRKALHVFENMIMVLMPEQSYRQTRSSFKKRSTGLKAICKVVDGHGFLWTLFPLLFKTQRAVDPTNPWLDPSNPKLAECSSDEED